MYILMIVVEYWRSHASCSQKGEAEQAPKVSEVIIK